MKGLLLKDFHMARKYCKSYLLIAAIFLVISCFGTENLYFAFYPVILCGIIPMNLLGYDERSRWLQYSGTLPYTKAQVVSSKYLIGLLSQLGMAVIVTVFCLILTGIRCGLHIGELGVLLFITLTISLLIPALALPFAFWLGIEKVRWVYYLLVGLCCGAGLIFIGIFQMLPHRIADMYSVLALCLIGVIALYLLSQCLSVVLFRRGKIF